jgi:hypothetical protein
MEELKESFLQIPARDKQGTIAKDGRCPQGTPQSSIQVTGGRRIAKLRKELREMLVIAEAALPPRVSRVESLENMENKLPKASLRFDAPESSISKS